MQDDVDLARYPQEVGDVLAYESEPVVTEEVFDVGNAASDQVVDGHDGVPVGDQSVTQMRAQKPGTAGDDDSTGQMLRGSGAHPLRPARAT